MVIIDTERLHSDIRDHLCDNPVAITSIGLAEPGSSTRWTLDPDGLLRLDQRIYVPLVNRVSNEL